MARRIGNILATKKKKGRTLSQSSGLAVSGDDETIFSAEGDKSVAVTVHSQTTVKASNRKDDPPPPSNPPVVTKSESKGWKTLKRLVGVTSDDTPPRGHANSEDFNKSKRSPGSLNAVRKRILSEDTAKQEKQNTAKSVPKKGTRVLNQFDLAIRGRLDGVDILSLGPASSSTLPVTQEVLFGEGLACGKADQDATVDLTFDPLTVQFTSVNTARSPASLVTDMVWASAGKDYPELILEGYIPGGDDRWSVKLGCDETSDRSKSPGLEDDSTADLTDDGSTHMPSHKLWDHIWGDDQPPPTPAHMQAADSTEEDILQLAAACSVPIDLDEDTFIITNPDHFRSVHELTMVPLQAGRFDSANSILEKLLKGLEENGDDKVEHLQGCTHHNIGIVNLYLEKFQDALTHFRKAVEIRTQCLPFNHPDIAVSLVREGQACLALGKYNQALAAFRLALGMTPTEDATRAKILNNIGVAQYQQERFSEALQSFTQALEIQRQWLDGSIRRESMVYDASITLGNMGKVFLKLQENDVAYSVFEEGFLLQTTAFHKDHSIMLSSLENMALSQAKNENYQAAAPLLRGLCKSKEARLGADNPSTIQSTGVLAFVLLKAMELDEGLELLKKVSVWQGNHMKASHESVQMTKGALDSVTSLVAGKASLWV
eukprot:Nitzschia sp. Nitz4//scaffold78_size91513//74346//76394//NITZ4_004936-RA/size91513-snap-gene-0.128-mRNA-1//1//CDS//3329558151//2803//frame0